MLAAWRASEPPHFGSARWALVSMGLDPLGRRVGTGIAGCVVCFVLYAWLVWAMTPGPLNVQNALPVTGLALFSAYEVWAFTHGRTTTMDSQRHKASLGNTGWRTVGLLLDLVMMLLCIWLFFRGV